MDKLDKALRHVDRVKRRASFAFAFTSLGLGLPLWLVNPWAAAVVSSVGCAALLGKVGKLLDRRFPTRGN